MPIVRKVPPPEPITRKVPPPEPITRKVPPRSIAREVPMLSALARRSPAEQRALLSAARQLHPTPLTQALKQQLQPLSLPQLLEAQT